MNYLIFILLVGIVTDQNKGKYNEKEADYSSGVLDIRISATSGSSCGSAHPGFSDSLNGFTLSVSI